MKPYQENPEVARILIDEEPRSGYSAETWRSIFSKFQAFEYRNARQRLADFELVVLKGLWIFQHENPRACVELAEQALTDEQFSREAGRLDELHYLKALALIKLGQVENALEYFLGEMQAMPSGEVRQGMYRYGIHLFIELKPFERKGEFDGRDDITLAPEFIIGFVREMMQVNSLIPKLPPALYESSVNRPLVSWGELHEILCVRASAEKRKALRQRFDRYREYGARTYPSLLHVSCSKRISPCETSSQTGAIRKKGRC